MQIVRELVAPCEPSDLFGHVSGLDSYPAWMGLVSEVRPADERPEAVGVPAWYVELRAKVGPLTRSKLLRMERTEHVVDERVVFTRHEVDGRDHSPWILGVDLVPVDDGTQLTMTLEYGGRLWSGLVLQRVLDDYVEQGSQALLELVSPS
ncbi:MAG: SRPBCC family protein [Actinomycetota bacterium]